MFACAWTSSVNRICVHLALLWKKKKKKKKKKNISQEGGSNVCFNFLTSAPYFLTWIPILLFKTFFFFIFFFFFFFFFSKFLTRFDLLLFFHLRKLCSVRGNVSDLESATIVIKQVTNLDYCSLVNLFEVWKTKQNTKKTKTKLLM